MVLPFVSNILFNANARVYNLRLLLLTDIVITALVGISLGAVRFFYVFVGWSDPMPLVVFSGGIVIGIHHIFALFCFHVPVRGLALIDLVLVFLELGLLCAGYAGTLSWITDPLSNDPFGKFPAAMLFSISALVAMATLAISAVFRISTMSRAQEKFVFQRLAFLGCCRPVYPPYTVTSILLNRSLARPLVRGESKLIIFARALVISCLGVVIPAFAFYSIVALPHQDEIYLKSLVWSLSTPSQAFDAAPFTSFILTSLNFNYTDMYQIADQIEAYQGSSTNQIFDCSPVEDPSAYGEAIMHCPVGWQTMQNMSISLAIPPEMGGVYLSMQPWYSKLGYAESISLPGENVDIPFPIATLLLPGSRLFGLLTWTARLRLDPQGWMYQPEIIGLQSNPNDKTEGSDIASLTLFQVGGPTRILQEVADASILSGISSLGGFWTFVNGGFALLFGANIIYFAFGRRPLSALGVVHLFQRHKLVRQWHEDFPALHTEGGPPGSESAGIVAFIRERLVDLNQHHTDDTSKEDMEATGLPNLDVLHETPELHSWEKVSIA